jgi:hypothetical protein
LNLRSVLRWAGYFATRGNLCPTILQLKACPGLVSGGFEGERG